MIKVGSELMWLWVAIIEVESKKILGTSISKERNMFIADERFLSKLVKIHGYHPVSIDGGTWYPQVCVFLKLVLQCINSFFEKSLIERTIHYIKYRTMNALTTTFHAGKRNIN